MSQSEKFEVTDRRVAYQGYFRVSICQFRHTLFAGGWSPPVKREVFERGPVVAVLHYDPRRDEVSLIRQVRAGALAADRHPWIWEVVAGEIEAGEAAEGVARREAVEEAGIAIDSLMHMHTYLVSPGGCSEVCSSYLGRADLAGVGGVHGLAAEGEDIMVRTLPLAEARAMLERGEIGSSLAIVALQWLALHRERVRTEWR